ncbi:unnamed protein product, partial [Rotaria sordida]
LTLDNSQQQKNDSQYWSIIQYSYLTELELVEAHKSYLEEFLLDTFSALFVPHFIWVLIRSSYICIGLYILGIYFAVRWFARGGHFDALHTENLSGKTYLITGSAGGIGKQTALELAKRGAKVVLFARPSNLQQTIDDVKKVAREAKLVSGYPLDLADLVSIKKGVEQYKVNEGEDASITALINNAG